MAAQRAHWARILFSALPQRLEFNVRANMEDGCVWIRFNERYFRWYLLFLVIVGALLAHLWFTVISSLFLLTAAQNMSLTPSALLSWITLIMLCVFFRDVAASGSGTVSIFFEDLRDRFRRYGTLLDQKTSNTLTNKERAICIFLGCFVLVSFLAVFTTFELPSVFSNARLGTILLLLLAATVQLIGWLLVKGTVSVSRPAGGEERFAAIATGVSTLVGIGCILGSQLAFHLIGKADVEFWSFVFQVERLLESSGDSITLPNGEVALRERAEFGLHVMRVLLNSLLMVAAATCGIGLLILYKSFKMTPIALRLCMRVHSDIDADYARDAASGGKFFGKFKSAFFAGWCLSAILIGFGFVGLIKFGVSCFSFGYSESSSLDFSGPVVATANMINFLGGLGEASAIGPWMSRVFFLGWTVLALSFLAISLSSLARRRIVNNKRLERLRAKTTTKEHRQLGDIASVLLKKYILPMNIVISDDPQPTASAHVTGIFRPRHYVEISKRCLDILTPEELKALIAHEMAHHVCGHCTKHNLMQWMGRWTFVGGTFVGALENSFGFELEADQTAVSHFGILPVALKTCLMKMRSDAVVQELKRRTGGLGILANSNGSGHCTLGHVSEMKSWKARLYAWFTLYTSDTGVAYWHPSVNDRIAALDAVSNAAVVSP